MRTRVALTSTCPGASQDRCGVTRLRELHEKSDGRYSLVNDPADADLVLAPIDRTDDWGLCLLNNEIVRAFPRKTCVIHDAGYPRFLLHGLYSSNRNSLLSRRRIRTGAYSLSVMRNPFVATHDASPAPPTERRYLFSYVGRPSHWVRAELLHAPRRRSDVLLQDPSFDLWSGSAATEKLSTQRVYYETLMQSKFALCPRGIGHGSMRLFEAMCLGVAPVVLSDGWIPPTGPDWREFCIFVQERQAREVERIVEPFESEYERMGRAAREAYETYFSDGSYFNYVVENCLEIVNTQPIPESLYWALRKPIIWSEHLRDALRIRSRLRSAKQALGLIPRS